MGVNSLPKTVTRQRRGCDLNSGLSVPEWQCDPSLKRAILSFIEEHCCECEVL